MFLFVSYARQVCSRQLLKQVSSSLMCNLQLLSFSRPQHVPKCCHHTFRRRRVIIAFFYAADQRLGIWHGCMCPESLIILLCPPLPVQSNTLDTMSKCLKLHFIADEARRHILDAHNNHR